jgi:YVTN family beta-propeller protein
LRLEIERIAQWNQFELPRVVNRLQSLAVRAISCTLILTSVMALASPHLFGVERDWADSVIKTITVGTGPYGDLFDPDNGYIYVADQFSNSVTAIDGSTNTVVATITEPSNHTPQSK